MRTVGLALILLLSATAVAAQDRARLDDFSLPAAEKTIGVEQLPSREAPRLNQPRDRSVSVPQPAAPPAAPVVQVVRPGDETGEPNQLTGLDASRRVMPAAVSSAADSRPAPSSPIGGADRCDPQALQGAERAECLRILELRAAEFRATEAPQMTAEERLLSEQWRQEHRAQRSTSSRLSAAAAQDPDADLITNQEIAVFYLERESAASHTRNEMPAEGDLPSSVVEALHAILPLTAVQN